MGVLIGDIKINSVTNMISRKRYALATDITIQLVSMCFRSDCEPL